MSNKLGSTAKSQRDFKDAQDSRHNKTDGLAPATTQDADSLHRKGLSIQSDLEKLVYLLVQLILPSSIMQPYHTVQ